MDTRHFINEPDESVLYGIDVNPFVGLRPYEADESFLFFGRDKQISELLQKLYKNRFIGVVGSSGCGKSSLIKAGLIPKLKAGFLSGERDQWVVASMRPGDQSLLNLSKSVNESLIVSGLHKGASDHQTLFEEIKQKGVEAIVEKIKPVLEKNPCNMLLLVDQFEELFTIKNKTEKQKNDDITFVNILLALSHKRMPIYVIITMRSDYIGRCNKFYGLPEVLNESQYLVPRLNRQQLNEIIELPVKLYGENISSRLVDHLLNDSDKDLDQLPVLQHCLMRTYRAWLQREKNESSEEDKLVGYKDYQAAGGLQAALSKHANRIFTKHLDEKGKKIAELVFRSLTDANAENEPIRRPQTLAELLAVCNSVPDVTREDVINVIEEFRKPQCAFLTPYRGELEDKTIIDISHESLMRQWVDLRNWMVKEQSSGRKFIWLSDSARSKRELLRGIDLKTAIEWQKDQNPTYAWAIRYGENFEEVNNYIQKSKKSNYYNKVRKYFLIGFPILLALGALSFISYMNNKTEQEKNSFLSYTVDSLNSTNKLYLQEQTKMMQEQIDIQEKISKDSLEKMKFERSAYEKLDSLNKSLATLNKRLESKNSEYETEKLISSLKTEDFYRRLDTTFGNDIIQMLIPEVGSDRFPHLLEAFNLAGRASDTTNSIAAINLAKKAWKLSQSPLLEYLLLKSINSRTFPCETYNHPFSYRLPTNFDYYEPANEFLFNEQFMIYSGTATTNNISLREPILINSSKSITDTSLQDIVTIKKTPRGLVVVYSNGLVQIGDNRKMGIRAPGDSITCQISNNGMSMVTMTKESYRYSTHHEGTKSCLWDISGQYPRLVKVLDSGRVILVNAVFSPDSRQLAMVFRNSLQLRDTIKIMSLDRKEQKQFPSQKIIYALNFSPDSRNLITMTASGNCDLINLSSDRKQPLKLAQPSDLLYYTPSGISISQDMKKLIVEYKYYSILYERGTDELFSGTTQVDRAGKENMQMVSSKLLMMGTGYDLAPVLTRFIDDNSIMAVGYKGDVYVWKLYPEFTNLDQAFEAIEMPELTIKEKLSLGLVSAKDVMKSGSVSDLKQAIEVYYYGSGNSLDTLIMIYTVLKAKDPANKDYYEEEIGFLNYDVNSDQPRKEYDIKKLMKSGSNAELAEAADQYYYSYDDKDLDTAAMLYEVLLKKDSNSRESITNKLIGIYELYPYLQRPVERLVTLVKNSIQYSEMAGDTVLLTDRTILSQKYGKLSWYQILIKEFNQGKISAQEGLLIDPSQKWIIMNLAHAYMFLGDFENARVLYDSIKLTYSSSIIDDFSWLYGAKLIRKDQDPIYSQSCEILNMLMSDCEAIFRKEEEDE